MSSIPQIYYNALTHPEKKIQIRHSSILKKYTKYLSLNYHFYSLPKFFDKKKIHFRKIIFFIQAELKITKLITHLPLPLRKYEQYPRFLVNIYFYFFYKNTA